MALKTKGLKKAKSTRIRRPLGAPPSKGKGKVLGGVTKTAPTGGGTIGGVSKTRPKGGGNIGGSGYTPGTKIIPGGGGTKVAPVRRKTKPIPGRKAAPDQGNMPGSSIRQPNRAEKGRMIAAKKKVFAAKRANKLANQKKLAARKRALGKKRKMA